MNKTKIGFSLLGITLIGGGIGLSASLTSCNAEQTDGFDIRSKLYDFIQDGLAQSRDTATYTLTSKEQIIDFIQGHINSSILLYSTIETWGSIAHEMDGKFLFTDIVSDTYRQFSQLLFTTDVYSIGGDKLGKVFDKNDSVTFDYNIATSTFRSAQISKSECKILTFSINIKDDYLDSYMITITDESPHYDITIKCSDAVDQANFTISKMIFPNLTINLS
ncbi:MAG: hypothetical protein LBS95_01575 [Mycoplasmataceae bacterium]|jgi:hypothetical protein|nr:hypothetical protein [Mycoplasmataceae bacterium]